MGLLPRIPPSYPMPLHVAACGVAGPRFVPPCPLRLECGVRTAPIRTEETPLTAPRPTTLKQLRDSGWQSKSVKHELRDNFLAALKAVEALFPGIVGYENTVIPEISIAVLAA